MARFGVCVDVKSSLFLGWVHIFQKVLSGDFVSTMFETNSIFQIKSEMQKQKSINVPVIKNEYKCVMNTDIFWSLSILFYQIGIHYSSVIISKISKMCVK